MTQAIAYTRAPEVRQWHDQRGHHFTITDPLLSHLAFTTPHGAAAEARLEFLHHADDWLYWRAPALLMGRAVARHLEYHRSGQRVPAIASAPAIAQQFATIAAAIEQPVANTAAACRAVRTINACLYAADTLRITRQLAAAHAIEQAGTPN